MDANSLQDRLPPQNRDAERALLGGMLRDNNVIGDILQIVRDENFYSDAHQKVFQGVSALYDRGQPADFSADMVLTYANANCGNVQPFAP